MEITDCLTLLAVAGVIKGEVDCINTDYLRKYEELRDEFLDILDERYHDILRDMSNQLIEHMFEIRDRNVVDAFRLGILLGQEISEFVDGFKK